jgi:hypothetical protein
MVHLLPRSRASNVRGIAVLPEVKIWTVFVFEVEVVHGSKRSNWRMAKGALDCPEVFRY